MSAGGATSAAAAAAAEPLLAHTAGQADRLRRCRETCAADLQTRPPSRLSLSLSLSLARSSPRRAGTIWVPLGFNDPTNSSYYPVLLEIDATKTPATMTQHWLDESKAKGGIWSLFWTPNA